MLPDRLVSHSAYEEDASFIAGHTGSKKVVVLEGPISCYKTPMN
ncbi:unnamed protein product [Ectocarpus sp. 8 AP-2014]